MLHNPVLVREFLTGLRTRRALGLGFAYLAILATLVMAMWPAEGVYSLAASSSHRLFALLSLIFLGLVALCAPSFTALAISGERERETWDLLYDTLLRPDEIVLGKLVAGVGMMGILIVGSLPMMGACLLLGGVTLGDVAAVYAVVGVSAALFGLLGLWCSATFRNSYRALILCYVFILGLAGATWVPSVVLGLWAQNVHVIHLIRALSPFAAVLSIVQPGMFSAEHPVPATGFGAIADGTLPFFVFAALLGAGLLALTLRRVAQPPATRSRKVADPNRGKPALYKRFPFVLLDPERRNPIHPWLNVIAVKEMRVKAFGHITWLVRAMMGCAIASLILAFLPMTQVVNGDFTVVSITCIAIPLALIILIAPVLTASAICGEREAGVFDLLRCTPVTPRLIVNGKLQVAWLSTALLLLSCFPTFFVLTYVSSSPEDMEHVANGVNLIRPFNFQFTEGWAELAQVKAAFALRMGSAFGVVMVSMLFASSLTLATSAFCDRTSTATAIAYGAVLFYAVGTLIPYYMAEGLPASVVHLAMSLNPFAAAARAVSDTVFPDLPAGLWISHLWRIGGVTVVLLTVAMVRVWLLMRPQR